MAAAAAARLLGSLAPRNAAAAPHSQALASAWLQHLLDSSCRSMRTSSSSSSSATEQQQQQPNGATPAEQQQPPAWKEATQDTFSIRPSVLSPLHPLHRELQEVDRRLVLLQTTLQAHLKLSDELHPKELEAHQSAEDPVAEALAARRAALQAVVDSTASLLEYRVARSSSPDTMKGYYGILEGLLAAKDQDASQFKAVVEGERSVWDYWFAHFTPQYAGLPGLGSLERIYNQVDEEVMLKQLAKLRATTEKPPPTPQLDALGRASATGGRKTSSAQVWVWRGAGRVVVNRKPLDDYFGDLLMRSHVLKPLAVANLVGQVDMLVHVQGGGVSGQAQAVAHGIAKALRRLDPELKPVLRAAGLLKRDPRAVERKKFGKAKARKSFAWVKR